MSVRASAHVWNSDLPGNEMLVALALADYADDDGGSIFPSVARVAWKVNMSERTAQRILKALRERGVIEVARPALRSRPTEYRLMFAALPAKRPYDPGLNEMPAGMREEVILAGDERCALCGERGTALLGPDGQPWHVDRIVPAARGGRYEWGNVRLACATCNRRRGANLAPLDGVPNGAGTGATGGTQPVRETSSGGGRAGAPAKKLRIGRSPVEPEAWAKTERVLAEFNAQTGRDLRLLTSAGIPSEAAKRIYGRVVAYPDLSDDAFADIIRRTLASRWWGDDRASIGVVFGPAVFEENIARKPTRRPASARDKAAAERDRMNDEGIAALDELLGGGRR